MGRTIGGGFQGTGATLYMCIGFVPDWVEIRSHDDPGSTIYWDKFMFDDDSNVAGGLHFEYGEATQNELDEVSGIRQYYGGTLLSSSDAGTTTYGEGVYLKKQKRDYRYGKSTNQKANYGEGDAVADKIDTWTLDTAGSRSGHFNEDVTGTYIGAGSPIQIDGLWYRIMSVTAAQGEAANEVVLNAAAKSGVVQYIGGMYGEYVPMVAGETSKDGFVILDTGFYVNTNGERCSFKAGTFDD